MKDHQLIILYFISVAALGTAALQLPGTWEGQHPLSLIDAAFTAVSAVCVTGLITVDTAQYSILGQVIIMILIQAGGLGIITFATLFLLVPGNRFSFHNRRMIRNFYVEGTKYDPVQIIRNILLFTFIFEAAGTLVLAWQFRETSDTWLTAVFHAVSAFCNAGFSTFSDNLESWNSNAMVLLTVSLLVIAGGLSFVVLHDISDLFRGKKRRLSLHSSVVLLSTLCLLVIGTTVFWFTEPSFSSSAEGIFIQVTNAFFHAVTPRTAGFNSLPMSDLNAASRSISMALMFVGGAPGSMAGGIKVTTLFLVVLGMFRGIDEKGNTAFLRHRISARAVSHAGIFIFKAILLVAVSAGLLILTEENLLASGSFTRFDLLFESVSAFGTVGLSTGVTSGLSTWGKVVIIITMLSGRIGLVFMASDHIRWRRSKKIEYPHGEVLTG